jgi:hypothetical protein
MTTKRTSPLFSVGALCYTFDQSLSKVSLNHAGMPNDLIRDDVVIKLAIRSKKS